MLRSVQATIAASVALAGLAFGLPVRAQAPASPAPAAAASPPAAAPAAPPAAATSGEPEPSPSALLVAKRCGSCHSIGEGDKTGPDLLGVTTRRQKAWMSGFVRNPTSYLDGGDPIANELLGKFKNVRMPEQPLTDEEFAGVYAYLEECGKKGGCKLAFGKVKPASEATPADVANGKDLFEGRRKLANGGPACIACHNVRGVGIVGGGTLAKDLTFAFARLGDAGLSSALSTTPYTFMKDVFGSRPLKEAEAFQLKAYLADAAKDGSQPRPDSNFLYLGVLGTLVSLGAVGTVWRGRMRGVRQRLVAGGRR